MCITMKNGKNWSKLWLHDVVDENAKVGLIGHFKDESSYYLKFFPEWAMVSWIV